MDVFMHYRKVRTQFEHHMPHFCELVDDASKWEEGPSGIKLPSSLFDPETDPGRDIHSVASEMSGLALMVLGKMEISKDVEPTFGRIRALLNRIDEIFGQLEEVVQFFQPAILAPVCEWATRRDNPKKRTYQAGLMSITCKRDKGNGGGRSPK
jgi:hypothetical protein